METSPESHVLCVNDLVGCLARECDSSLTCLLYLHVVCSGKKNLHGAMKCRRQVRPGLPAQTLHRPSLNDELICGRTQQKGHQKADQPRSLCTRVLKTLTDRPHDRPAERTGQPERTVFAAIDSITASRAFQQIQITLLPTSPTPHLFNDPKSSVQSPESAARCVPRAVSLARCPSRSSLGRAPGSCGGLRDDPRIVPRLKASMLVSLRQRCLGRWCSRSHETCRSPLGKLKP